MKTLSSYNRAVLDLEKKMSVLSSSNKGVHPYRPDWLVHSIHFIRLNLRENISVVDIAASANKSQFHFIREFKRNMGVTPRQYLIVARIESAKKLLCSTNMTVARITNAVGYKDTSQFNRLFRGIVGKTPGAFRHHAALGQDSKKVNLQ